MSIGTDFNIVEKQDWYLIETPPAGGCKIGFTKNSLPGILPRDLQGVISEFKKENIEIAYLNQIHSARVCEVKGPGVYEGDGLFTHQANLALAVKTADCLPLLFYDQTHGFLGAVHMGWRSAQAGILDEVPCDLSSCVVLASVGLRRCCYRVGDEFSGYAAFKDYIHATPQGLLFDSTGFARQRLIARGLKVQNFLDLNICSRCSSFSSEPFPSYRRDKTERRTLSFIVRI